MNFWLKSPHWVKALILYTIISVVYTYPLIFNLNSSFWGIYSDNTTGIWQAWYRKYALFNGLDLNQTNLIGYPFGNKLINNPFEIFSDITYNIPFYLLTFIFNEIIAFNLISFFSFVLTGLFTYLFAYSLTKHKDGSFLAGLAFTLAPFHFWQSWTHISFGQLYWLPLYFWALYSFLEKKTTKSALLFSLSLLGIIYTNIYYTFFLILLTPFLVIFILSYKLLVDKENLLNTRFLKNCFLVLILTSFLSIPYILHVKNLTSSTEKVAVNIQRPINDLLALSLRPWDLLIPPQTHPIMGKYEGQIYNWVRSLSDDYKTVSAYLPERVNYLGIIPLLFSFLGIYWGVKNKQHRFIVLTLSFLAFVAFLFSLPPFIYFKTKVIYFPTNFVYKFITTVRVYARLGIIVMLSVSVLTAFGVKFFGEKLTSPSLKKLGFLFISFLLLIDFYVPAKFNTTSLKSIPEHYQFLSSAPSGAVVEYPWDYDLAYSQIYQRYHQKPLLNMPSQHPYWEIWPYLKDLENPQSWELLEALGIRYVSLNTVNNTSYVDDNSQDKYYKELPDIDLTEAKKFPEAVVQEIKPSNKNLIIINANGKDLFITKSYNWEINGQEELMILNLAKKSFRGVLNLQSDSDLTVNSLSLAVSRNQGIIIQEGFQSFKIESSENNAKISNVNLELKDL